ncbi:alpha-1,6-mannosyl-glycoprotein beta-1,2-N-acetylglucosaminyltransferase [Marchantia polymorpha subsp. ruderalis]|uniref:Alpha-1,6-mannosyl-glycoprotein 2-beta-N-acetylglucosaminyltransferase n=2 Tax=Marchantia polymorpha TaxID=3197 RepID=A0AAF6BG35_MARPO|nr:hypothetical protein MARPO_0086s0006 [Marchantia polymorpha]BBN10969.1 hypothetical protein Mp_5g08020 [Marchantia polymorpha subsp. ruderalis]|eukprot:PTQ33667.1 hypothetical protein MARPO_0086s0006 [Marchantia polymorpha]
MQKSGFSFSGCSRRRFLVLMLFQLIAMCLVWTVLQHLSTDISEWLPRSLSGQEWELNEEILTKRAKLPFSESSGDPNDAKAGGGLGFIPFSNELSRSLHLKNQEPPRNRDLFPELAADHVPIVLYVHNRPQYLQVVVDSLAKVKDIEKTLLIVSHDGYFPAMNAIVDNIKFCQVKPIYAIFSPHLFQDSFPGLGPDDCRGAEDHAERGCVGNPDQYGNHRAVRIISLKHHWWWMMNTVWDGLAETRNHDGNILFIEEDHVILPDAYCAIQMLIKLKATKCPECLAVNLAPVDVNSRGENYPVLIVEKIGNVGYSFNRTVFNMIHSKSKPFCKFDDYNWDITMWAAVFPSFPSAGYTLRGPRASAMHFGKCGLHQGQEKGKPECIDDYDRLKVTSDETEPYLNEEWKVMKFPIRGYNKGFEGWGGWGDKRDQQLCLDFSIMYRRSNRNMPFEDGVQQGV